MQWYLVVIFVTVLVVVLLIFHASGFLKAGKSQDAVMIKAEYKPKPQLFDKESIAGLMVIGVFVVMLFSFFLDLNNGGSSKSNNFSEVEAVTQCQMALKALSRDPDTAEVPYVPNAETKSKTEYYFAWGAGTKYARMRNGLGLEVPVSAACIVDGITKKITYLTFNGQTII